MPKFLLRRKEKVKKPAQRQYRKSLATKNFLFAEKAALKKRRKS